MYLPVTCQLAGLNKWRISMVVAPQENKLSSHCFAPPDYFASLYLNRKSGPQSSYSLIKRKKRPNALAGCLFILALSAGSSATIGQLFPCPGEHPQGPAAIGQFGSREQSGLLYAGSRERLGACLQSRPCQKGKRTFSSVQISNFFFFFCCTNLPLIIALDLKKLLLWIWRN